MNQTNNQWTKQPNNQSTKQPKNQPNKQTSIQQWIVINQQPAINNQQQTAMISGNLGLSMHQSSDFCWSWIPVPAEDDHVGSCWDHWNFYALMMGSHWENHWETLRLKCHFLRLHFFGSFRAVHSKGLWRTRIGNFSWPTWEQPVPGAPQTLSDAIEEENFEFDVPWDSQKRWTYKGKNPGGGEMWEVFWFEVGSWKIFGLPKHSFCLFQDCISVFYCPDSFPKWPCVLLLSFPWFRSDSGDVLGWMFTSWCQDMSPTTWWHVWKHPKICWKGKEEN